MPDKKILLLAYACSPYQGSEPGIGWNRVYYPAKYFDIWVICREEIYKEETQRFLRENGGLPSLHFVYVKHSRIEKLLMKSKRLYYFGYNLWHRRAYRVAKELHKSHGFSLVHMTVYCGFREPGYLWKLPIPFVWGPVSGVQNYPWRFLWQAGFRGALSEGTRNVLNTIQIRFSRRVRNAMRRACVVMAATSLTARELKSVFGIDPLVQLDVGSKNISEEKVRDTTAGLKIVWSGLFEHRKGLQLLLQALSQMPKNTQFELHVLGKGPLDSKWRNLADKLGVSGYIRWLGWLPHNEAIDQYDWANVFVFTSLRDTTGTVILEALSHGIPVICLDHQGAADVVTSKCGIKVAVTNPAEAIAGIRNALVQLHDDKGKRMLLSRGALVRAQDFLWEKHTDAMRDIYNRIILNT
jgi:glycosyltransferase involved in cell wall biosynthesis